MHAACLLRLRPAPHLIHTRLFPPPPPPPPPPAPFFLARFIIPPHPPPPLTQPSNSNHIQFQPNPPARSQASPRASRIHSSSIPVQTKKRKKEMAVSSGMAAFSVRPLAPARPSAAATGGGARMRSEGGGGGAKWWAPLLGWSGQPDYIDAQPAAAEQHQEEPPYPHQHQQARSQQARRFGVLTEDKARRLRTQMMETETFHDAMYHSAIASRLASAAPDNHH